MAGLRCLRRRGRLRFGDVSSGAGIGSEERRLAGVLTALAGDGSTVLAGLRRGDCALLVLWKPPERPRELRRDCTREAVVTFDAVALSGGASAWTRAHKRGLRVERTLSVSPLQRVRGAGKVLSRAVAFERRGRSPTGETIDSLVGDPVAGHPSFAFRKHRYTGAAHRPDAIYLVQRGEVRSLLRNVVADLTAADAGRVALVFPLPGRTAILGTRGETLTTFDAAPDSIPVAAELTGDELVIVSGRRGAGIAPSEPFMAESRSLTTRSPEPAWKLDGLPLEARAGYATYRAGGRLVRRDLDRGETAELLDAIGPTVQLAAVERGVVAGITRSDGRGPMTILRLFPGR